MSIGVRSLRTISRPSTARPKKAASPILKIASQIFSWLICQSYDDKGNAIVYDIKQRTPTASTSHRSTRRTAHLSSRSANRYLKRIKYGNRTPNRDADWNATDPAQLRLTGCSRWSWIMRKAITKSFSPMRTDSIFALAIGFRRFFVASSPRSFLGISRRVRSTHLPPLSARADVSPLP